MAYAPSTIVPRDFATTEAPVRARRGFFSRLVDSMILSRQHQAEREIARYLRSSKFTDEAEREIERRFLSTPTRW